MPRGRRGATVVDKTVPTVDHVPFKKKPTKSKLKGTVRKIKNLKGTMVAERQSEWPRDAVLYAHLSAPVPLLPIKKYCDLTGLEAPYRDPKTHLLYHSRVEFSRIHDLSRSAVTALLSIRGANAQHVTML